MNICIFGGAFDPVHKGHTAIAVSAVKKYNFDKLLFMVSKEQSLMKLIYYLLVYQNQFKNLNPKGLRTTDCVVRGLAGALNRDWETTYRELFELGLKDITNPGLGSLNRLYMAAELLNLKREAWNGVKLCLVEELEAHLHPQAQMKVINKLIQCSNDDNIQFILTTHSPNLTSKLPLENLIYCHNKFCYPMGKEYKKLENDDK